MRLLEHDDEDAEDASPSSLATAMDGNDEARQIIDALPRLDAGKYDQRRLTDLDDGIHSGLERRDTKGMFFYFTASRESGRAHFWRYYDLDTRKIIDNRYHPTFRKPHGISMNKMPHRGAPGFAAVVGADH